MKVYNTPDGAKNGGDLPLFIPKICPFAMLHEDEHLCGNWCPHFNVLSDGNTLVLSCGGQERIIKLEK